MVGEAYANAHPEAFDPTHEDYNPTLDPALREQAIEKGITFAKTSAAFTAFISGQDPNVAAQTAENAVVENAFVIPVVLGGLALYEAYEIYDIFEKQGSEAAAEKLIEIGIMTAVGAGIGKAVFKIGSKVYPSAEAAFMAYKSQSPLLTKITENLAAGGKKASRFIEKMKQLGRQKKTTKHLNPKNRALHERHLVELAQERQRREVGTVIAGGETGVILRDTPRLQKKYGGRSEDWVKKSSTDYIPRTGGKKMETHWYENTRTGKRYEFKTVERWKKKHEG